MEVVGKDTGEVKLVASGAGAAAGLAQPTLAEVMEGADVFLGLSVGGVLKQDMVEQMGRWPRSR